MLTRFFRRGAIPADQRPKADHEDSVDVDVTTCLMCAPWSSGGGLSLLGRITNNSAAGFSRGAAFVLANVPVPAGISPAYDSAKLIQ
jgi:hypothetical protein